MRACGSTVRGLPQEGKRLEYRNEYNLKPDGRLQRL